MGLALGLGVGLPYDNVPGLPPSFSVDFLNETPISSALITYSGGANATRVNSAGLIVPAVCPRIDYDPVTLAPRGLLVEEQRTNLEPQSGNLTVAGGHTPTAASLTQNLTAPNGAANAASTIQAIAGAGAHFFVGNSVSYTTGLTYVLACRIRPGSETRAQITGAGAVFGTTLYANFGLTGAGSVLSQSGLVNAGISQGFDGWYWCWIVATATATASGASIVVGFINSDTAPRLPSFTATGSETLGVWGVQTEAGAFPTSYIPTAGSAVTRTRDEVSVTGVPFNSWFVQGIGTVVVEYFSDRGFAGNAVLLSLSDLAATNRVQLVRTGPTQAQGVVTSGGSSIFGSSIANSLTQNQPGRFGAGFDGVNTFLAGNNQSLSYPSGAPPAGSAAPASGITGLYVGANSGFGTSFNNHIRRILYWNTRLPNATLQALTA